MPSITADTRQLERMIKWIGKYPDVAKSPDTLRGSIVLAGKLWEQQFTQGGGLIGAAPRWPSLAGVTIQKRIERGYPAGPILTESGGLKRLAATTFASWRNLQRGALSYDPAPYPESGPLHLQASSLSTSNGSVMRATIIGSRVENQYGGSSEGRRLPARPFWFFPEMTVRAMADKAATQLLTDWSRRR